jgi:hypothetical protein
MPHRKLPNSNPTRYRALRMIKDRKDAVPPPAIIPFLPSTIIRFDVFFPIYKAKFLAVPSSLGAQTGKTAQVNTSEQMAQYFIWDFIDALQKSIRRGEMEKEVRSLYSLPLVKGALPALTSEQEILDWRENIHEGETNRIAAGGTAIALPTLAQVDTAVANFRNFNIQQAELKIQFDTAEEELENANVEADKLILKLWNEIEAAFDEGDKPSTRRKSRDWGVVYLPNPGEAPSPDDFSIIGKVMLAGAASPIGIDDVSIIVVETAWGTLSHANGDYFVATQPPGTYTLLVEKPGFVSKTIPGVVVTAGAITTLNIELSNTGIVQGTVQEAGLGVSAKVTIDGTPISVFTNPMGDFTLPPVPAGTYILRVSLTANPVNEQTQNIIVTAGGTVLANFSFA